VRREHFIKRTVRISGLVETEVARKVTGLLKSRPPLTVGIYAKPGEVELAIMSKHVSRTKALAAVNRVEKTIRRHFGADVYGVDDETVSSTLGALLRKKKATLALAESCTGGLASSLVSDVPGSSDYLVGSLVTYSNRIKEDWLGVAGEVLQKHGAVSPQTAWFMAKNVRQVFGAGYGIGITGIAGPSGGSAKKPVGLVYIALAGPRKITVTENRFYGTRTEIKSRAAKKALDLLRRALLTGF
jgi:nicotinamide-nucleotide amidase